MNCPNCGSALAERGSFCKACGAQARCLNCKDILETNAAACVECGTKVGVDAKSDPATTFSETPRLAENRNTISFQEDKNSRTFSASLTDQAVGGLSDALADFFLSRGALRQQRGQFQREPVIEHPPELPSGTPKPPPPPTGVHDGQEKMGIAKIFRHDGQTMKLIDRRLKAKNGQDFVKRLTYLFLFAHEIHGRHTTLQTEVIAVLKEGKVWDSNASHWLKKRIGMKAGGDDEDQLELVGEARDDAKRFLREVLDESVGDDWNPDKKVKVKRAARKKKGG
jgi:hypothetical protein